MGAKLVGYRGIANSQKIIITGHAFKKHRLRDNSPYHNRYHNFRQTVGRFRLRPMKHTSVEIEVDGQICAVKTNRYGHFTCEFQNRHNAPGWYPYHIYWNGKGDDFTGEYRQADEDGTGVISDIDDTVLVSHSTKMMRKLSLMLFKNAYTRKTIPFIKHWYQHIHDLNAKLHPEDFFYVSNSEWNLYDFLHDFFEINDLPKGVFFLQNLKKGFRDIVSTSKVNLHHKANSINFLMRFYPSKPYILIGDNGQKDMEIYRQVCHRYPDRIKGVMIRKLVRAADEHRFLEFQDYVKSLNIPFLFFH